MLVSSLATGFTTGAGLIVCIGSQNAFVLRQGLLRSHTALVATVCIVSDVFLIFCGLSGLGFIVKQWPGVIDVVRYAGAAFLAVNAYGAAKRAWQGSGVLDPSTTQGSSLKQVLLTCLGYTWLNPHVYLDTVVMLGSLSLHYDGDEKWHFGAGAMLASAVWFIAITYGARLLLPLFHNPNAWRILDGLIVLMMVYLSVTLLMMPLAVIA
ncbi:LysE/ArgO family amino acid transporter [Vibrio tritonius]|uniref:LysE/ArgO family amino acid transporter n=1 Tax=Vibrio tritonius TaxID=1435069 RepID=UPI00315D4394